MAARDGMENVISELRVLTDLLFLEPADAYAEDPEAIYWTDEILQNILDEKARKDAINFPLKPTPEWQDDEYVYLRYYIPQVGMWEEDDEFVLTDSTGTEITDEYTVDHRAYLITFLSDTSGSTYYLTGRYYNMNEAAAQVWLKKAAMRASLIHWKAGDHTLHEDQEYKHCLDMYKHFSGMSGKLHRFKRVDYA